MALIDLGFGSKDSSQTTTVDEDIQKSEQEIQQQASINQQVSQQIGTSATLDEQTQALVKDLISNLSTGVLDSESKLLSELASTIGARAKTAQADVTAQISPIISESRRKGEKELQALQTQTAQQAGGSLANTLVTSSVAEGRASLESQLAKTEGELFLQGREQVTRELESAISGTAAAGKAPVENISALLNILKGASVETTQVGEQQSLTEASLVRLLDSITSRRATTKTDESSSGFDFGLTGGNPGKKG